MSKKIIIISFLVALILSSCGIETDTKTSLNLNTSLTSESETTLSTIEEITSTETTTITTTTPETSTPIITTEVTTTPVTTIQTTLITSRATTQSKATITPKATASITTTPVVTTQAITVKLLTPDELIPLAEEIFKLTNLERKKAGVPELKSYTILSNAAQIRAEECAKNKTIEHKRPDGRPSDSILDDLNLKSKCSWWGENAAYCSEKPKADFIMNLWMNSSGHKANILMERYTHVGIGVAVSSDGGYYFIQEFAEQKRNTVW